MLLNRFGWWQNLFSKTTTVGVMLYKFRVCNKHQYTPLLHQPPLSLHSDILQVLSVRIAIHTHTHTRVHVFNLLGTKQPFPSPSTLLPSFSLSLPLFALASSSFSKQRSIKLRRWNLSLLPSISLSLSLVMCVFPLQHTPINNVQ